MIFCRFSVVSLAVLGAAVPISAAEREPSQEQAVASDEVATETVAVETATVWRHFLEPPPLDPVKTQPLLRGWA